MAADLASVLAPMPASTEPRLPGTWKLAPGRAFTLRPTEGGVLRVAHGRLWVTLDGPHGGALNEQGDLVVETGESVRLRAGQRLVIEPWCRRQSAYFSWDPALQAARTPLWAGVTQPLADLRLAVLLGVGAAGRLAGGLARLAWGLLAPVRAPLDECALKAQSKACRAHGAMS